MRRLGGIIAAGAAALALTACGSSAPAAATPSGAAESTAGATPSAEQSTSGDGGADSAHGGGSAASTTGGGGGTAGGAATFPQSFATDDGDGAKCTMALSGDSSSTTAQFTMGEAGELISHVADNNGNIGRHDDQVTPGSGPTYTYPYPPSAVTDVGAILYVGSDEFGCTITQP